VADQLVKHIYRFTDDLIADMEIQHGAQTTPH
jgi:hypothetical protein